MTEYPDFQTPQAHATAIAATGVPLLISPTVLTSQIAQTLAAGGGGQRFPAAGFYTVTQVGYQLFVQVQSQATSTSPFLKIRLQWADAGSGLPLGDEEWIIPAPSSGPYGVVLEGQAKGNQAFVTIQNADTKTQTFSLVFQLNSQIYPHDRMRPMFNLQSATVPGFTLPADIDMPMGLYGMGSFSAAAGATTSLLIATYNGLMQVKLHMNSGGAGFFTFTPIDPFTTVPNDVVKLNITSPQDAMYNIYLPRVPTTFSFHNTGSVTLGGDVNLVPAITPAG